MQTLKKLCGITAALSVLLLIGAAGSIETKTDPTGHGFIWAVVELAVLALSVFGLNRIGGGDRG